LNAAYKKRHKIRYSLLFLFFSSAVLLAAGFWQLEREKVELFYVGGT
jgi:cytochrome oxidase assembly protein ShyY1